MNIYSISIDEHWRKERQHVAGRGLTLSLPNSVGPETRLVLKVLFVVLSIDEFDCFVDLL